MGMEGSGMRMGGGGVGMQGGGMDMGGVGIGMQGGGLDIPGGGNAGKNQMPGVCVSRISLSSSLSVHVFRSPH